MLNVSHCLAYNGKISMERAMLANMRGKDLDQSAQLLNPENQISKTRRSLLNRKEMYIFNFSRVHTFCTQIDTQINMLSYKTVILN